MAVRSGSSRYRVRESEREIIDGIAALLREDGLSMIEIPTRRGVRLRLELAEDSDASVPTFEIAELELRFRPVGEELEVELCSRTRRRYWTLALLTGIVLVDLFVSMGLYSVELGRSIKRARRRRECEEPLLLAAAGSYLGRRDLGQLAAAPFRR